MEVIKKIYEGKTIPLIPVVPSSELRPVVGSVPRGGRAGQRDHWEQHPHGRDQSAVLRHRSLLTRKWPRSSRRRWTRSTGRRGSASWAVDSSEGMSFDINYQERSLFYCYANGNLAVLLYKS